jgi:hypothetical protein
MTTTLTTTDVARARAYLRDAAPMLGDILCEDSGFAEMAWDAWSELRIDAGDIAGHYDRCMASARRPEAVSDAWLESRGMWLRAVERYISALNAAVNSA